MKKKKILIAAAASVFMIFAIAAALLIKRSLSGAETAEAKVGALVEAVYGLGTVTANRSYQLKLGVAATIRELYVRAGDSVTQGQALVKLDQGNLFRAPFAGTVTALPFKSGETVFPQIAIVTIMDLKDRYVLVSLEQEGALRIRPSQTTRMSFETLRGKSYAGRVRSLYPGDNQFIVAIDIPDLPEEIIPGMTGDVAIEVARRENVLMVPLVAVQAGYVQIKGPHGTKKVRLTIGAIDGRWAEVTSGPLHAGDPVLLPRNQ